MDLAKMDKHADLVNRMGHALGVDIVDAVMGGHMLASELRGQVLRCMQCTNVSGCEGFLKAQEQGAEQAPSYCENASMFALLSKRTRR